MTEVSKRGVTVFFGSSFLLVCTALAQSLLTTGKFDAPDNLARFERWSQLATSQPVSPAWDNRQSGDFAHTWIGPNNAAVKIVVRMPTEGSGGAVSLGSVAPNEDARPYFENAIAEVRRTRATTLRLTATTYRFSSTEARFGAFLLLEHLNDFVLDGNGAVLEFLGDSPGILIQQSQRLQIKNLTLKFKVRSTSLGTIVQQDGQKVLRIDHENPVGEKDKIFQLAEVAPGGRQFVVGGTRLIFPRDTAGPSFVGSQTYVSDTFSKLPEGTRFFAIHNWYSSPAVKIEGFRNESQTEDISLNKVRVRSTPGMGITVHRLKRGLAVIDCEFAADPNDDFNAGGPSWDGVHVTQTGGDIVITGSRFANLGDDAININSPIHPVKSMRPLLKKIVLRDPIKSLQKGDRLGFFDGQGRYLSTAVLIDDPNGKGLGRGEYEVTLDQWPENGDGDLYARNLNLLSSRYLIRDNQIEDLNGHGILAQLPDGLIQGNTVNRAARNAIRLLSSVGQWNEGIGAFNVAVRGNRINDGGADHGMKLPWSAISIYGGVKGAYSTQLMNGDIEVSDNKLAGLRQGCIAVLNSRNVKLARNTCGYLSGTTPSKDIETSFSLGVAAK